ncbi:MAG: lamin tail domain-containing protein, partial [Bacteroidota bacterium]
MRIATLLLCLLVSCQLTAQTNHSVAVTSNVFTPDNLTIQVGDTVTWTNTEGRHNVNGQQNEYPNNPEGFFSGPAAMPTWTYQFVFNTTGTYDYQCDPHVNFGMTGKIVVEAPAAPDTILITELMYNPPESNTDSLEFIELYNPTDAPVNLEKWTMSDGVNFTFPAYILEAGNFLILAVNETAFRNTYNYTSDVFEWESGALSNGGEDVALSDSSGTVIFTFEYDDRAPWPEIADGDGPSIVLCDISADPTMGTSWQAATTATGTTINNIEILADPGSLTDCAAAPGTISWLDGDTAADEEDGTLNFRIVATNFQGGSFTVSAGTGTTLTETDYTAAPTLPASFTVGDVALDTFTVAITITDDEEEESDEVLELELATTAGEITGDTTITLTVRDNDTPIVVTPIDDINDLDANGVAISDGQTVTLQGVVHCIDFRAGEGLQFWIIEENGDGINVFNFDDVDDYVVTEGDELQITGEIEQFRGLLEIVPTSNTVVSTENPLTPPLLDGNNFGVGTLEERFENRYITKYVVGLVGDNPIVRAGGGWNVTAQGAEINQVRDTFTIRVEDETGIDST